MSDMFPGFGLLSKETAVVSLDPGPLGLEVDAPTGVVQQVRDPLGPTGESREIYGSYGVPYMKYLNRKYCWTSWKAEIYCTRQELCKVLNSDACPCPHAVDGGLLFMI